MKVACTHFQCAAGIFTYLKENFQSDTSPDISFELMAIYIQTMLVSLLVEFENRINIFIYKGKEKMEEYML